MRKEVFSSRLWIVFLILISINKAAISAADFSRLNLSAGNEVDILIVDSSGKRTGYDSVTQRTYQEIPRSAYFVDSLNDDITGRGATETSHLIQISQPAQGTYVVSLSGLTLGAYSLAIHAFSQDGQPHFIFTEGVAAPGSVSNLRVEFKSTGTTTPSVTRLVSFATTIADINNCLRLGLITSEGIAKSLLQKLEAAEKSNGQAKRNILNAFKAEVNAQRGKQITGIAPDILIQDADSLAAS